MEITTTNIRVQASKNYQVFEISFEATNCQSSQDIESLKSAAITYALKGINELCDKCDDKKPEIKVSNTQRIIQEQPQVKPVVQPAQAIRNPAPVQEVLEIGTIKVFDGFRYKFAYSKKNNQYYWVLVDLNDMQLGAKKYYNPNKAANNAQ